ncbi:hypothetical protein CRUP_022157 [Coryphaenoides rupestris]|nr:hypothetical protein CRUP_022157 [Coryphaenoides rupestris]
MDLRGSSSLRGLRGAERACSLQHARLASGAELLRAVQECSFSACTRGWLYDGSVGNPEVSKQQQQQQQQQQCGDVGGSSGRCNISSHNTRLGNQQRLLPAAFTLPSPPALPLPHGAAGLDLGDELLYVCAPGHRMPGGNTAFSLLCDSCGEWYGLVQMCLKDESEPHVDYEDKFPDGYGSPDAPHSDPPGEGPEAEADHHRDYHGPAHPAAHNTQRQQDQGVFYTVGGRGGPQRHDQQGEEARGAEEEQDPGERGQRGGEAPLLEQQPDHRVTLVRPEAATTAPVSQLSQKHMFWFPSEAFHEEEGYHPAPSDHPPTAQVDQSVESEDSRPDDHDHQDDHEEQADHDDSRHSDHDDRDDHGDHDDHGDRDDHGVHDNSRQEEQEEDDLQQSVKPYNPGQRDHTDRYGRYGDDVDPRDHYDMGEHEDDHALYGRVRDSVEREHDVDDEEEESDNIDEDRERDDDEEEEVPDSEEQDQVGDAWPGRPLPHQPTPAPGGSHDPSQDSVSSYPDYDHHTEDPALVWDPEDPSSRQPLFPDPDPGATRAPLSGEAGERPPVPVEGEMGEAVCIGADCPPPPPPPPTSSSRGPIVAAVVVAICAVATVAAVGAWLYRRRQQKNSMYQLNGKDLSQRTPDHQQQQIEMQQKV